MISSNIIQQLQLMATIDYINSMQNGIQLTYSWSREYIS